MKSWNRFAALLLALLLCVGCSTYGEQPTGSSTLQEALDSISDTQANVEDTSSSQSEEDRAKSEPDADASESDSAESESDVETSETDSSEGDSEVEEPETVVLSQEEVYQLYAEKVTELEERYGKPVLNPYPNGDPRGRWYYLRGLSYLQLTDFNGDGREELVVCYWKNADELPMINVYAVYNGECREVYSDVTGGQGSPVVFEVIFSEYKDRPCIVNAGTRYCDVFAFRNGKMECVEEQKDRADYGWINFHSEYYTDEYYSNLINGTIGYTFNFENGRQALIHTERIREYSNVAREALHLEQWRRIVFDNPGVTEYYVSTTDKAAGVNVSDQLLNYLKTEVLPMRPQIKEFTFFRPYAKEAYRTEREGRVYEGAMISPGEYRGQMGALAPVFRDLDQDDNAELVVLFLEEGEAGDKGHVRIVSEVFYEKDGQVLSTGKTVLSDPALGGHGDTHEFFFADTAHGVCICSGIYTGYAGAFSVAFNAFRYNNGELVNVISESHEGQSYMDFFERVADASEQAGFPKELTDGWRNHSDDNPIGLYCSVEQGTEKIIYIKSYGVFPQGFMGGTLNEYLIAEGEDRRQELMAEYGDVITRHATLFENGEFGVTGFFDIIMGN